MLHGTLFVHGIAEGRIVDTIKPRPGVDNKNTHEAGQKPVNRTSSCQRNQPTTIPITQTAIAPVEAHPSQRSHPLIMNFPMTFD